MSNQMNAVQEAISLLLEVNRVSEKIKDFLPRLRLINIGYFFISRTTI